MTEQKKLYIAYEPWHVEEARAYVARGATIICLDFLIGQELKRKDIPFVSLRDVVDAEKGEEEWWELAQDVAREWYRLPAMKFFEHRGIRIGEVVEPVMMGEYLTRLFYYVRIYSALKKTYQHTRLIIPFLIMKDATTDKCLVSFERRAIIDATRMVGLQITILDRPVTPQKRLFSAVAWKSLLVRGYTMIISFLPHRKYKIYASEYWSHIGPVIEHINDTELILTGSGELKKIPWRQILKHRIRIRHPDNEIHTVEMSRAIRTSEAFTQKWKVAKKDVAVYLAGRQGGLDWSPVLEACEYLMAYAPRIIAVIDALQRIMGEEKPDVVLQLASVSGRHHHFFIMARVAAQLRIPSIELQHGVIYIDPRVALSRIETDYLATYGADTNIWHERIGHARNRLIATGSPRFDQYRTGYARARGKGGQLFKQLGLDTARPVLLVAVPFSAPALFDHDSYQLIEFFETIRAAQSAIPGLQVLFKCRNGKFVASTREYVRKLFHGDYAIAGSEDIFALLCTSDAVVCGNSTIIYQTMLVRKPLVLYGWKVFDTYNAQMYTPTVPFVRTAGEAASVLARIFADASYRSGLLARQKYFLEKYSLDGKSSERIVEFIKHLAREQK